MKKQKVLIEFKENEYNMALNTLKQEVSKAMEAINAFNSVEALPNITDETFGEFISDPVSYYDAQVLKLKEKRFKGDPINMEVFKNLYNITDLNIKPLARPGTLEMKEGKISVKESVVKELKERHTITTDNPKVIQYMNDVRNMMKEYDRLLELISKGKPQRLNHQFAELGYYKPDDRFSHKRISEID